MKFSESLSLFYLTLPCLSEEYIDVSTPNMPIAGTTQLAASSRAPKMNGALSYRTCWDEGGQLGKLNDDFFFWFVPAGTTKYS